MKILFCSGEVYPFSKTGGLADVAASLPKALKQLGHEVYVISPYYQRIANRFQKEMTFKGIATVEMADFKQEAIYYETKRDGISYLFVDNKQYFDRNRFYDHADDAERFTFFNFAILESLPIINFFPDIIHVNDWQTGLLPFLLDEKYRKKPNYQSIKTLLSIHNLEKQGIYDLSSERLFNSKNYTYIHLGKINFLKCGIMRASKVNTVSKSYRDEILTKFYGFTLDGPLKSRQFDLHGILNGLDHDLYNPSIDKMLPTHYDDATFIEGKRANKEALYHSLGFSNLDTPLAAFIGRYARQKGISLFNPTLEELLDQKALYLIAIGEGDFEYETYFASLAKTYPSQVYHHAGFDHALQQRTYAASDIFLMPSLFEPCGLNQMIAMRYGSIPLVRLTGGLKDTVTPYPLEHAVGFSFTNFDKDELKSAFNEMLHVFNDKSKWNQLIKNAMKIEHDVSQMAIQYESLYQSILLES